MIKKHLLFDFDGVIVDSLSVAYRLIEGMNPGLSLEEMLLLYEGNVREEFDKTLEEPKARTLVFDRDKFYPQYMETILSDGPIQGISKMLRDLSKTHELSIVSSSESGPIEQFLKEFSIRQHFGDILGGDKEPSKIRKIEMVCEKHGSTPTDCLFITDTLGDIREAREAGTSSIGVSWGYHSVETLQMDSPTVIVNHPDEIIDRVHKHF